MADSLTELARPLEAGVFARWVAEGWRVPMLTCYDAPMARALTAGSVPMLLVGDSVGPVMLGLESVRDVTAEMIAHHTAAVRRGAPGAVIVADLPHASLATVERAVADAERLVRAGADMVKIEAGAEEARLVRAVAEAGFFVMGHAGHKPQRHEGGSRVAGAGAEEARRVFEDAAALQEAGASVVLFECVPARVAAEITRRLAVPTIGIGAGAGCRGQVLVVADLLGWYDNPFRFLLRLDDFAGRAREAAAEFARKVRAGEFPDESRTFRIKPEEFDKFVAALPPVPSGGC